MRRFALASALFAAAFTAAAKSPFDFVKSPDAPAPAVPYRPVGPETGVSGEATGFFHVETIGGRDWAVDPAGRAVWLSGVEHVRSKGWHCSALGYSPYGRFVETNYPSLAAWADETTRRLADWGFAVVSGEVQTELRRLRLAHTPCLFLSDNLGFADREWWIAPNKRAPGSQFPNVFHPDFPKFCDHFARCRVAPHKDDPWLAGWFLDNELAWHGGATDPAVGLFDRAMALPPEHSARRAAERFAAEWGGGAHHGNGGSGAKPPVVASRETKRRFLLLCAEIYFRETTAAIRRHDPNHLILGCRFAGIDRGAGDPGVFEIAGQYCDVISFNLYPWADLARNEVRVGRTGRGVPERLRDIRARAGKPLLVTEWSFPALDTGRPCYAGAGQRHATQEGRVAASELFARTLAAEPGVVGYDYFMWYDQPGAGASNVHFPEDSNYGLVNEQGVPYEGLTRMFAVLHADAGRIHAEGDAPVPHDAPPEPSEAERYAAEARTSRHAEPVSWSKCADGAWVLSNGLVRLSGRVGGRDMVGAIAWDGAAPVARWGGALVEWQTPDGREHYTDVSRVTDVAFARDDATGAVSATIRAEGEAEAARFAVTHRITLAPGMRGILVETVSAENLGDAPLRVLQLMMRPFALGDSPPKRLPRVPNRADGLVECYWGLADGSRLVFSTHDPSLAACTFWIGDDGVQHPDARFSAPGGPFAIAPGATWFPPVPMAGRLHRPPQGP